MQAVRFSALDVLRGLIIGLMILVNTPGSWSHVYSPLLHASWDGFTVADIVFPGFLFVVGAAMFYALKQAPANAATIRKVVKRSVIMFGCGLLLNWFWAQPLAELRLFGVLQRIALCYLCAAFLLLFLRRWQISVQSSLPIALVLCLVLYWLVLQLSAQPLSLEGNLVRQVDLYLFGSAHLYQGYGVPFDPEGLLSTLPAIGNVLIGYWVAAGLASLAPLPRLYWLLRVGTVLVALAAALSWFWPVNKPLWSGSYVLLSSGLLIWLLALMLWLVDIRGWQRLAEPLKIYGSNPLFIYMLSSMWSVLLAELLVWQQEGQQMSAYQWLFDCFALILPAKLASLAFALVHVLWFWWLSRWLYRRQIFIKI